MSTKKRSRSDVTSQKRTVDGFRDKVIQFSETIEAIHAVLHPADGKKIDERDWSTYREYLKDHPQFERKYPKEKDLPSDRTNYQLYGIVRLLKPYVESSPIEDGHDRRAWEAFRWSAISLVILTSDLPNKTVRYRYKSKKSQRDYSGEADQSLAESAASQFEILVFMILASRLTRGRKSRAAGRSKKARGQSPAGEISTGLQAIEESNKMDTREEPTNGKDATGDAEASGCWKDQASGARSDKSQNVGAKLSDEDVLVRVVDGYPLPDRNVFYVNRSNACRLGRIIQAIVQAWARTASIIGFRDLQDMIGPYMIFDKDCFYFRLAATPGSSFVHKDSRYSLNKSLETSNAIDAFPTVQGRSEEVHRLLRLFAARFLDDMVAHVEDKNMYRATTTDDEVVRALRPFRVTTSYAAVSERFEDLRDDIAKCRRLMQEEGTTALYPDVVAQPTEVILPDPNAEGRAANSPQPEYAATRMATVTCLKPECPCKKAREDVEAALRNYARIYAVSLRNLISTDFSAAEDPCSKIENNVQLVLTDPPYNYRRLSNRRNSETDRLTFKEMQRTVQFCADATRPGAHVVLFCSMEQHSVWLNIFRRCERDGEVLFRVDPKAVVFPKRPGVYSTSPLRQNGQLLNVYELALHAIRKPFKRSAQDMSNYGYLQTSHPGFVNVLDNVGALEPGEAIPDLRKTAEWSDGPGRPPMLRPEQKSRDMLKEIIARLSKPGDLVVDPFAGSLSTAFACVDFNDRNRRIFVGCEKDKDCFDVAWPHLVNFFAHKILNKEVCNTRAGSDGRDELEGLRNAATEMLQHVRESRRHHPMLRDLPTASLAPTEERAGGLRGLSKKGLNSIGMYDRMVEDMQAQLVPPGMPATTTMPVHVTRMLAVMLSDWRLLRDPVGTSGNRLAYGDSPPYLWPRDLQEKMRRAPSTALVARECEEYGLLIAKSTIKSNMAGNGVFAARYIRRGEIICPMYGHLIYKNFTSLCEEIFRQMRQKKLFKEGETREDIMACTWAVGFTISYFRTYAIELKLKDRGIKLPSKENSRVTEAFLVPFTFCVAAYINDPSHQDRGPFSDTRKCHANVEYFQSADVRSKADLRSIDCIRIKALEDIHPGEELFVDYTDSYDWESAHKAVTSDNVMPTSLL